MKLGSLFSGYGGLEMGIRSVLDTETAWFSEIEPAPSKVLAHHWPTTPNLGDITQIDWNTVEPVDVLCGGFPCQDVSLAGLRRGLHPDTRSGLWSHFALAIDALRPQLVIVENVRGLLSATAASNLEPDAWDLGEPTRPDRPALRALGAVLGDLADLGYDTEWVGLRAADAGAPHGRFRVFVVAYPARQPGGIGDRNGVRPRWGTDRREPHTGTSLAADADRGGHGITEDRGRVGRVDSSNAGEALERERPRTLTRYRSDAATKNAHVTARGERRITAPRQAETGRTGADPGRRGGAPDWGVYGPAIRRWEYTVCRAAPHPTIGGRLSAQFTDWMMGLDHGHITSPAIGLTRNEQLKALGNGVVPQQAALAISTLLARDMVTA